MKHEQNQNRSVLLVLEKRILKKPLKFVCLFNFTEQLTENCKYYHDINIRSYFKKINR